MVVGGSEGTVCPLGSQVCAGACAQHQLYDAEAASSPMTRIAMVSEGKRMRRSGKYDIQARGAKIYARL